MTLPARGRRLGRGPGVPTGRARLVAAVVLLAAATTFGTGVARPRAAAAQAGPNSTTGGTTGDTTGNGQLRLTSQTTWVESGGNFQIGVSVAAGVAVDDQLQLTVYSALPSRSDFTASLAGHQYTSRLDTFNPVPVATAGSQPVFSLAVNHQGTSGSAIFLNVSGVYPVTVDLFDANNQLQSQLVTFLVYNGPDAANNSHLDVAWVAPFTAPPAASPTAKAANQVSSADQAALDTLVHELAGHPTVPVTLDVTPQTVDALSAGSSSERATVSQLSQLVTTGASGGATGGATAGDQLVGSSYVQLDLPAMEAAGLDSEVAQQVVAGRQILATTLGTAPDAATWVDTGPLTPAVVDDLAARGVRDLVAAPTALSPLPASDTVRTPAQPFSVLGKTSHLDGVAVDQGLAAHFVAAPDELLAAHQLLAELAMIEFELPNRRGGRGVVVVPPDRWQPNATFLTTFLDGLSNAPMLAPVTVSGLMAGVTPLQSGAGSSPTATLARTVLPLDQQPKGQTIADAAAIRAVRAPVAALAEVVPTGTAQIGQIDRQILVSESADLTDRSRAAQLAAATAAINQLKGLVHLPGNQSVTFTARNGRLPITMLSSAPYPLKVRLQVTSGKLEFQPVTVPGGTCSGNGSTETCSLVLGTQDTTVRVPVVARTTGVFSLTVALQSPDGTLNLATNQDTVRSTAVSGVGAVLSILAALLLAVWWLRDVRHSRRARRLVPRENRAASAGALGVPPGGSVAGGGSGGGHGGGPEWERPSGEGRLGTPGRHEEGRRREFAAPTRTGHGVDVTAPESPEPPEPASGPPPAQVAMHSWDAWGSWEDPSGLITQPMPIIRSGDSGRPSSSRTSPRPPAPDTLPGRPWPAELRRAAGAPTTDRPPRLAPVAASVGQTEASDGATFARNTVLMAGGTMLSRLTGFVRVLALIWAFGISSGLTDAYNVANTVPNIIYDLVLGGILSATLVPVFVDYFNKDDPSEGRRAISAVVTTITVTLAAISALFWVLTPAIIHFYFILAPSNNAAREVPLGISLLHTFVPQLFLLGGIAVTAALLNARRRFAATAFSPVANNVIAIGAIVGARVLATTIVLPGFDRDQSAVLLLGLGTTAGYLVQLIVQIPPMLKAGFRLRPVWDIHHPAVRTVLRLSLWTFGSVVANQISFNLILVLADQKTSDVTVFNTAYQFFQLPYAIFAVSIASVITTELAEHWTKRDLAGFRHQTAAGLRLTLAVLVPAAAGYVVLAQPFLHVVLRHGSLTSDNAHRIAGVVALFAAGLPGFSAYLLLMRAYQAMQNTRSMFYLYLFENGATVVLAAALYPVMGVGGLALGWVGAYSLGAIAAIVDVRRRIGGLEGRATVTGLVRVTLATALMLLPVFAIGNLIHGHSDLADVAQVAGGVVVGAVVYLAAAYAFGVNELISMLRRRGLR